MTDAEYEAIKARVDVFVDRWIDLLGLAKYATIYVTYHRETGEGRSSNFDVAASMDSQWQYRQGKLNVYCGTIALIDDDDLNLLIVHELSHFLLGPIEAFVPKAQNDRLEFTAETLARAFRSTHRGLTIAGEY